MSKFHFFSLKTWYIIFFMIGLGLNAQEKRPNIVLIMADDLNYDDISPYGNKQVKTPNLEKLASQGMSFDNMFTTTAMCSPSRQQILSGLYPVRSGAFPNHSYVYKGTKSIAHYMKESGYLPAVLGKKHFGDKSSFPFNYLGGIAKGKHKIASLNKAKDFIAEAGEQPFFLLVASLQPHVPWTVGDTSLYPPEKIAVPEYMVDTPKTRESLSKYYAEVTYFDGLVGRVIKMLEKSGKADNTIIIFTSEQGSQFPFAKWTCYDHGLKTSFIVKWPGKVKPNSRNLVLLQYVDVVPTLLDIVGTNPKTINTGRKDAYGNTGFDGISFKKNLLDVNQDGRDFVFGVQTTKGIHFGSESYPIRSVRNDEFLMIKNLNHTTKFSNIVVNKGVIKDWSAVNKKRAQAYRKRPAIELYDVKKDPYQLHNLAGKSKYSKVISELEIPLREFMVQQGDKGMLTEADAILRQPKPKKNTNTKKH